MAATFKIFFQMSGPLNGEQETIGNLYTPYTITTTSDIISEKVVTVANATLTMLYNNALELGGENPIAAAFIPTIAGRLGWSGDQGTENQLLMCRANVPVLIPLCTTVPYNEDLPTMMAGVAEQIESFWYYIPSGGPGKVAVFVIG